MLQSNQTRALIDNPVLLFACPVFGLIGLIAPKPCRYGDAEAVDDFIAIGKVSCQLIYLRPQWT